MAAELSRHHFCVNSHLQLTANISPVVNVKIFLPVIVGGILRINIIKQDIVFKASESYIKFSGSSAVIKVGVFFVLFFFVLYSVLIYPFK